MKLKYLLLFNSYFHRETNLFKKVPQMRNIAYIEISMKYIMYYTAWPSPKFESLTIFQKVNGRLLFDNRSDWKFIIKFSFCPIMSCKVEINPKISASFDKKRDNIAILITYSIVEG